MTVAVTTARPTLEEALAAWKQFLAQRGFSTDLLWLFEENLCLEKSHVARGQFHFAFQTRFTPPPEDALDIAYDYFSRTKGRLVFYRAGVNRGRSVCLLLCDSWFDGKGESEGYVRRDEWHMSFHPALNEEIEEIADLSRWLRRTRRHHRLHDLDFCMTLATVEEIKTCGRPLAPYERFAQTMFNRLRRFLGQPA